MADTTKYSRFRLQVYRLALLSTFLLFAIVLLFLLTDRRADSKVILLRVAFGLFMAASLFSIFARRFTPFAWALFGFLLLGLGIE
jgi:hypothetical protein